MLWCRSFLVCCEHIITSMSGGVSTVQHLLNKLYSDQLLWILWVGDTLMVLASLKWQPFLIPVLLLLYEALYVLFSCHFVGGVKILRLTSDRLLALNRKVCSNCLDLSDVKSCGALHHQALPYWIPCWRQLLWSSSTHRIIFIFLGVFWVLVRRNMVRSNRTAVYLAFVDWMNQRFFKLINLRHFF